MMAEETEKAERVTIEVPANRVWCGRGHYVRLPGPTENFTLRLAHPSSAFVGLYIPEDADEFNGCPFGSPDPEEWKSLLWGVPAVEIAPDDHRRRFRLEDGRIIHDIGLD